MGPLATTDLVWRGALASIVVGVQSPYREPLKNKKKSHIYHTPTVVDRHLFLEKEKPLNMPRFPFFIFDAWCIDKK